MPLLAIAQDIEYILVLQIVDCCRDANSMKYLLVEIEILFGYQVRVLLLVEGNLCGTTVRYLDLTHIYRLWPRHFCEGYALFVFSRRLRCLTFFWCKAVLFGT